MQREEIWTEKYRPRKLEEVVGQDAIIKNLRSYVRRRNLPHLIFSGPAGVGKTAAAIAMAHELYGETWAENFTELNASDERGIEVVRNQIKNFARTMPIGNAAFKIIFLDEADALTDAAQSALRRTMERYSGTCRFILSCNYSSKIIEPIQSRCSVYRFKSLSYDAIASRIKYIAEIEGLKLTKDAVRAINYVSVGDMRRAVNALQSAAVVSREIKPEMIYEITATARPEEIEELITRALDGKFFEALDKLADLMDDKGISGDEILAQMHRLVINMDIPARKKVELMDRIGEADYRITEGANERIQLDALLASFCLSSDLL
ncbi:MAG: replication factor C small subunit [Methanophagales archaeon]|nr:replication factor C small subunit [Methanophagales archaeon]MCW3141122.1 replication factor C small subunit [Methanophagales archaeon]